MNKRITREVSTHAETDLYGVRKKITNTKTFANERASLRRIRAVRRRTGGRRRRWVVLYDRRRRRAAHFSSAAAAWLYGRRRQTE